MKASSTRGRRGTTSLEAGGIVAAVGLVVYGSIVGLGGALDTAIAGDASSQTSAPSALSVQASTTATLRRVVEGLYGTVSGSIAPTKDFDRNFLYRGLDWLESGVMTRSDFVEHVGSDAAGNAILDALTEYVRLRDRGVFASFEKVKERVGEYKWDWTPFEWAFSGLMSTVQHREDSWNKVVLALRRSETQALPEDLAERMRALQQALREDGLDDATRDRLFAEPAASATNERRTNLGFERLAPGSNEAQAYLDEDVLPILRSTYVDSAGETRRFIPPAREAELLDAILVGDTEQAAIVIAQVADESPRQLDYDVVSVAETAARNFEPRYENGSYAPLSDEEVERFVVGRELRQLERRGKGGEEIAALFALASELELERQGGRGAAQEAAFLDAWFGAAARGDLDTVEELTPLAGWVYRDTRRPLAERVQLAAWRMAGLDGPPREIFLRRPPPKSMIGLRALDGLYRDVPKKTVWRPIPPPQPRLPWGEVLTEPTLADLWTDALLRRTQRFVHDFELEDMSLDDFAARLPASEKRNDVALYRDVFREFSRLRRRGLFEHGAYRPARGDGASSTERMISLLALSETPEAYLRTAYELGFFDPSTDPVIASFRSRLDATARKGERTLVDNLAVETADRDARSLAEFLSLVGRFSTPDMAPTEFRQLYTEQATEALELLDSEARDYLRSEILPLLRAAYTTTSGEPARYVSEGLEPRLVTAIIYGDVTETERILDLVDATHPNRFPPELGEAVAFATEAFKQ